MKDKLLVNSFETSFNANAEGDAPQVYAVFSRLGEPRYDGSYFAPASFNKFVGEAVALKVDHGMLGDNRIYGSGVIGVSSDGRAAYFSGKLYETQRAKDLYTEYSGRQRDGLPIASSIAFLYDRDEIRSGRSITKDEKNFGAKLVFDNIHSVEELSFVEQGAVDSADIAMYSTGHLMNSILTGESGFDMDEEFLKKVASRITSWNEEFKSEAAKRIASWNKEIKESGN